MAYPFRPKTELQTATEILWTPPPTSTRIRPPLRSRRIERLPRRQVEAIEPRLLLSADHLISIAALQDGLSGSTGDEDGVIDALTYLLENDPNFDFFVPGLRFTNPSGASLNPMVHELFALNVDADHDSEVPDRSETIAFVNLVPGQNVSSPTDVEGIYQALSIITVEEFALSLMDLNDDGVVSFGEAADILITQPIVDFMGDFPEFKTVFVGPGTIEVQTTYDDLVNGFTDFDLDSSSEGFVSFLGTLSEPSILNSLVNLNFFNVARSGSSGFAVETDLSFTLINDWVLDLGFAAERLEIDTPLETPLPGGSISPLPLVTVSADFDASMIFSVGASPDTFGFVPDGDLEFRVFAHEFLIGTTVNIGFLGMEAVSGSTYEITLPYTAALIDPSSPEHLGFRSGDFAADGDGEIVSGTGHLTATDALAGDEFDLLYDVEFSLRLGSQTGSNELPTVDIIIDEDDTNGDSSVGEMVAVIQGQIDLSSLAGLVVVGSDLDGKLTFDVVDSDATDLGFALQNRFAAGGTLTAANDISDFSTDGSVDATIIVAVATNQAKVVTFNFNYSGVDATARRTDFLSKANSAVDAAFGANVVTVSLSGDKVVLSTDAATPIEITRRLRMTADYGIDANELSLAAGENFARLFDVEIDPANDHFDIDIELDAKAGITVVNGNLDGLNIDIDADLVTDIEPDGVPEFVADLTRVTADYAGFGRFDLADQLSLSANDTGDDVSRFFKFVALGPAEVINVIGQLRGFAERLPSTDILGDYEIPFIDSVIGENVDFSTLIVEKLLYDEGSDPDTTADDIQRLIVRLADPDAGDVRIPGFATAQELAQRLVDIGAMSSVADAEYDVGAEELTYEIEISQNVPVPAPSADFDLDLGPLGSISVEADVAVGGVVTLHTLLGLKTSASDIISLVDPAGGPELFLLDDLNADDGVQIADYLAITGASDVERIEGRLSGDANFAISVDGNTPIVVTIEANSTTDVTSDNFTTGDLVADINLAINATSLNGKIAATEVGGRIVLEAVGAVDDFRVIVTDTSISGLTGFGDPAFRELGLRDSRAVTVQLVGDALTVDSPTGTSSFTVELNNDGTAHTIEITLDGANTVNDYVSRINAEIATEPLLAPLVGKVVAFRSGQSVAIAGIDASVHVFKLDAADSDLGLPTNPTVAGISLIGSDFLEAHPNDVLLPFGRLAAPTSFTVNVGPASDTINIGVGDTASNSSISDLVDVINGKIGLGPLNTYIVAEQVGAGKIALRAVSDEVTSINITAGSAILGLENTNIAGPEATAVLRNTAAQFAPGYYGPSETTTFDLVYDTGSGPVTKTVTVNESEARDNFYFYQFVNDVNRALDVALGADRDLFEASFDAQRLVIRAADPSVVSFEIQSAADSKSITELKLYDAATQALIDTPPAGSPETVMADHADLLIFTNDGDVHRVTLDGSVNLADVKTAIETDSPVTVDRNDTLTGLKLSDPSGTGTNLFRVDSVNASRAVYGLGIHAADVQRILDNQLTIMGFSINALDGVIMGDEVGKLDFEDRLFLEQVDGSTPVFAVDVFAFPFFSGDSAIEANFGFVGVELEGSGVLHLRLGLELAQQPVTLADLFDAISTDVNMDGVRNAFDLAEVISFPTLEVDPDSGGFDKLTLSVSVPGGGLPAGFGLGTTPELVLTLLGAGDPFNVPAGALTPFDGATDVASDEITITGHGFSEGNRVTYRAGVGGTPIGGLTDGDGYYVHVVDANTIQLAETKTDLDAAMYISLTDGSGANHRLQGFNPVAPEVDVTGTDLGDLAPFEDVGFDNIVTALRQLADFLLDYASQGILTEEIPVLGISFNELIGVATNFAAAVDDIVNNPPQNLQALEQKIREAFGLPEGPSIIDLSLVDDGDVEATVSNTDMLKIALDLGRSLSEPLDVDLALTDESGTPFSVPVFGEISLVANADLGVAGTVDALFTVGVDLDDDGGGDQIGEVFLFTYEDDTHLNLALSASAVNLFFNASLGPLGISVIDGDADIQLGLTFENTSAAMGEMVSLFDDAAITTAFDGFDLDLTTGTFDLTFPVFFPTQSDFVGDIRFDATLTANSPFAFTINQFTFPDAFLDPDFFTNFDLLSSVDLVIEAVDLLLDALQDVMSGEIFGIKLPIVGDSLADGIEFVEDIRVALIDPFFDLIENTPRSADDLANLIQDFLFALLGGGIPSIGASPYLTELTSLAGGFPILNTGLGLVQGNYADIDTILPLRFLDDGGAEVPFADATAIQWDFNFTRTYSPEVDLSFDFSQLPAIGLEFDGGLAAEFFVDFGFGIGISEDDGPYINIDRRDSGDNPIEELRFSATAGLKEDSELKGSLGFLAFSAATPPANDANGDGVDDDNYVFAEFNVDLVNGDDAGDKRLSFFELGSLDFNVGFDTEANLALDLNLGFDTNLLPPVIAAVVPSLEGRFLFQWNPDAVTDLLEDGFEFGLEHGRDLIKIDDVSVDLGSFIGDFLGPIVSQIQEYTGPLQPIIDIITAPIPGVSDLAGRPISLVDIAAEFGEFDPSMIYAIADLISFVNSIPATPDSIKLNLGDFTIFGSGILSAEQIMDSTFDFAAATQEGGDLFDVFNNMLDPLGGIVGDALEIFDAAGNIIDSAFNGLPTGGNSPVGATKSILGGEYDTGEYGFDFPFLKDPAQIFGMLLGRPAVLITYDLAPFGVEFTWEQSFMIYGPLWGKIGVGIGFIADFAFGYDLEGVLRFADGGFENPLDLVAGFYVSDTVNPDGSGADVPELQLIGEFSLGAELNAGVASAGIEAAIIFKANFDLNDPDGDGRVRIDEILGNFLYEWNYGDKILAPVAIFDVSAELAFQIRAYLKILFAKFTFEITPPITLFEFSIEFDREPILATERGDGGILLHMGPNAASRLHGNTNDIAESFFIKPDGNDVLIWAPDLNVGESAAQRYSGDFIIGFGGEFDDRLEIRADVALPVFWEGGSGRDTFDSDGSGGGIISGNDGNDTLNGGSGGEIIYGNEGDDVLRGGAGNDLIFGDFGRVSTSTTATGTGFGYRDAGEFYHRIRALHGEKDGDDKIDGGEGNDVIFGNGGMDMIGGDDDWSMIDDGVGSPGNDTIFGDIGHMIFGSLEIRSTDNLNDAPDIIYAQGGNDLVYAGGGDDEVDGGMGDDTIYGETGFDHLSGGGDADEIHGGDQDDVIYGYRLEGIGTPSDDGADVIFGNDNNDFIRGNQGDDTIEGGRGADIIFGDENNDDIIGEAGPDFIFGGPDNDKVDGGAGNDIIFGDDGLIVYIGFTSLPNSGAFVGRPGHELDGAHRVIGDVGLDALDPFLAAGVNDDDPRTLDLILTEVQATDGDDYVVGGEGDDIAIGGDGDDTLYGDFDPMFPPKGPIPAGDDILIGDAGRLEFQNRLRDRILTVVGATAGADELSGNGGSDVLLAGGDKTLVPGAGDKLWGRMDESVFTDPALDEEPAVRDDDILIGDDGVVDYQDGILVSIFSVFSGLPDPALTGGDDLAIGNKHNDIIIGGLGDDDLRGAEDEDVIIGDNGRIDYLLEPAVDPNSSRIQRIYTTDTSNATGGSDTIQGEDANDVILGGADGDRITGNDDRDIIIGDNGEVDYGDAIGTDPARPGLDFVRSLDPDVGGNDTISGGGDKDVVIGGSFADSIFGDNSLAGGPDASADEDVLIGDQGEVEFNDDLFHADDLVEDLPDNPGMFVLPEGVTPLPAIVRIETTDDTVAPHNGGVDTIEGNQAIDVILGGAEGDILRGNEQDDIILGDEGVLIYDGTLLGSPSMAEMELGYDAPVGFENYPLMDDDPFSLDVIITKAFGIGGNDLIFGNEHADIALGGTGADTMLGDNDEGAAGVFDQQPASDAGQDILIGDQGRVTLYDAGGTFANNITRVETIDGLETDGDGDEIHGNDLADIIIGGVNGAGANDVLYGEADHPDHVGTPGEDIILGDEGILRFDVLPGEGIDGAGDELNGSGLSNNATLDLIRTFKTGNATGDPAGSLGGVDLIFGNGGGDVAMGGTDGDLIWGDLYANDHTDLTNLEDAHNPGPDILLGDGGDMRFDGFEVFNGILNRNTVTILQTAETDRGGDDVIEGNEDDDVILGGFADDTLFGESDDYLLKMAPGYEGNPGAPGDDVILGDNGELNWILQSDTIDGRPDVTVVNLDNDGEPDHDLDRITTIDPTLGGRDRIEGNAGDDAILGGTSEDLIWGDTPDTDPFPTLADPTAEGDGPDGNDLIFGDHGKIYPNIVVAHPLGDQSVFTNNQFFSIDTRKIDLGRNDILFGNGAHDIMLGGQGDDLMWGNDGDDDMIGGHNIAGGLSDIDGEDADDDLDPQDQASIDGLDPQVLAHLNPAVNKEFNDLMDGGTDDDVMAGDNAIIIRQIADTSPRFRLIGGEGAALHVMDTRLLEGIAYVDKGFHANIGAASNHLDMTRVRTVYLLDHDEATQTDGLNNDRRRFGNDVMVGGLDDDEMWGQLGDDIVQGDGALSVAANPGGPLAPYDPAQDADPSFEARNAIIDGIDARLSFSVFEHLGDGNDYIEGNGGSDRAYGGLGQDDMIGGSSTLFFYGATVETDRPDGADLLYGGAGNPDVLVRHGEFASNDGEIATGSENAFVVGAADDTIVPAEQRHAFDADVILGDNAEIYQIVTGPGVAETFLYEDAAGAFDSGYDAVNTIRVRAFNLVDYGYEYVSEPNGLREYHLRFLTTARGAGDLIYGETGDDILIGMTGNDVMFGNSDDDDLIGGIGTDYLLGGGGRDGILGDDGLILTSRNIALQGESLHGILPLDEDQGPLKPNEEVNTNAINAIIETPGQIQRAVINVEGELNKSVQLFAFRTDDVELSEMDQFGKGWRFNDIIFGGLGQDFIHAGDGDDAVSGAEALPAYHDGGGFGLESVNDFLVAQQQTTNVTSETGPPGFSDIADRPFWYLDDGLTDAFAPFNPGDILRFEDRGNVSEFALYDEFFPRRKIMLDVSDPTAPFVIEQIDGYAGNASDDWNGMVIDFLLNFDPTEGPLGFHFDGDDDAMPTDGDDRIFGDLANDWIVGGTGRDHMWGGRGDDLLNMDDDHDSGQGGTHPHLPPPDALDNTASDEFQAYADITYGGAGRDVLILNTGADRAIDWVGEFNSYLVPFSPFGAFHISRTVQPQLPEFLYALSDSDGADVWATVGANPALIPAVPDAELYVDQKLFDTRTDDPDPVRNYEPFGEIGLVLQPDRDWQDQTGAPADPQPGNLQGQREIMRRELFIDENGGPGGGPNAISFAADVGTWSVTSGAYATTPDVVGGEAISIHFLDQTIPSYVEILVTAMAEKDKQGWNSNAYIVFDYQSATDFKFAGFDAGLDKIRIGHRTEAGWIVDAQTNMQLRNDVEYDLTLVLHGGVATIYVNGGNATSFAFNEALNTGLLGLGTDNAKAIFDDWQVQKLPPVITKSIVDDFTSGSGYGPLAGNWSVAGGAMAVDPGAADYVVATQALDVQVFARLWIEATIDTDGGAGLAFDVKDGDNFKFAAFDAATDEVMIGHVQDGRVTLDAVSDFSISGASHSLKVSLHGGSVSVEVDGTVALGHAFASIVTDGEVGLFALSEASFDDAEISTDDPAYMEAEAISAAVLPNTAVGADEVLDSEALAAAIDRAKSHWLAAGIAPDSLAGVSVSSFVIADIPGDELALTLGNGTVLIDGTAAGHGWDAIDLDSVVAHEIGHLLGFSHGDGEVMQAELAPEPEHDGGPISPVKQRPAPPAAETLVFDPSDGSFAFLEAFDLETDGEYDDLLFEDELAAVGPGKASSDGQGRPARGGPLGQSPLERGGTVGNGDLIGEPLSVGL